jgi:hypothetical protein
MQRVPGPSIQPREVTEAPGKCDVPGIFVNDRCFRARPGAPSMRKDHGSPTSSRPCGASPTKASRPGRLMGVTACQDRHEAPRTRPGLPAVGVPGHYPGPAAGVRTPAPGPAAGVPDPSRAPGRRDPDPSPSLRRRHPAPLPRAPAADIPDPPPGLAAGVLDHYPGPPQNAPHPPALHRRKRPESTPAPAGDRNATGRGGQRRAVAEAA